MLARNILIMDEVLWKELEAKSHARAILMRLNFCAYEYKDEPGMYWIVKNRINGTSGKANKATVEQYIRLLGEADERVRKNPT